MFGLVHRGEMEGTTESEFEHLSLRLRHLWLVEHNEDGTHKIDIMGVALEDHTHDAADVVSGTFTTTLIPDLDAAKITSGTFDAARIPDLDAAKITTGVFADARLPTELAYEDEANIFTANQRINAGLGVNVAPPSTGQISASDAIFERGRSVAMGAWTTWSPSWTNLSVGNGTVVARFSRVGKTVHYTLQIVFGSTTSVSGVIQFSLPTNNNATITAMRLGNWLAFDSSLSQLFEGTATTVSATDARLFASGAPLTGTSSTVPFTWATSDQLYVTGTYEEP